MFKIVRTGARGDARLEADIVLTPAIFNASAEELGSPPVRARKIGYVAMRKAASSEVIETRSNGAETTNTARVGDFIVTNLSPERKPLRDRDGHLNVYVIEAARFADLYEPAAARAPRADLPRERHRLAIPCPAASTSRPPGASARAPPAGISCATERTSTQQQGGVRGDV